LTSTPRINSFGRFPAALALLIAAVLPALGADAGKTVLGIGSYWRVFERKQERMVPLELLREEDPDAQGPKAFGRVLTTDPPPADWPRPDFDDAAWFRAPGPFYGGLRGWAQRYAPQDTGLFCLRGKFTVADPKGVRRFTLSLAYRGGVRVFLNGREVLRRHLPKGRLTPDTPAAPYPKSTYVDAEGKVLPGLYDIGRRIERGEKGLADRVAARRRSCGPVPLPVDRLRRGTNVLALEVRRSAYRPEATKWSRRNRGHWPHVELTGLFLIAAKGDAILPNVARPDGVQVWNEDVHRIFSIAEYGDPHEPLRPVCLVGARNGVYSGQIVLGSTSSVKGLRAAITELEGPAGARVPAGNIRVRYARTTTLGISASRSGLAYAGWNPVPAFAALADRPPAKTGTTTLKTKRRQRTALGLPPTMKPAAVQPVWVTVRVPEDAAPGRYAGRLTLTWAGADPVVVPVELDVIDWTLPDPADYHTFIGIYQSPESVAIQYGVPMWSEKHWALLDKSFRLLGYLGNRLVVIPLLARTEFGNDDSMIPWLRQADGGYDYDFRVHDRYLRLASKYGRPTIVSYQVYRSHGWGAPKPDKPNAVTVVDPKTGRREQMKLPAYGTAESRALWKPLVAEVRKRFEKGGVAAGARPVLGICHDGGVHKTVAAQFKTLFPQAGWHYGAHGRRNRFYAYVEYMYVPGSIPHPARERRTGWAQTDPIIAMSQRTRDPAQPPMVMRTLAERALLLGDSGAGRMGLDYWPVEGSAKVMVRSLYSRWPKSSASQRSPHMCYLSVPGKDGALPTVRTEALREGLQEAEARIYVERALLAGTLPGDLADRCRKRLDRRTQLCRIAHYNPRPIRAAYNDGWRVRSERVYRLAAEVSRVLKSR
jgi:hypothetical protein